MTSKELLERIAALVALASSPSLEEARTAAHKACAMMREHGLSIGLEDGGTLLTRSVGVVAPGRPAPRRTPEHRTVIVFRCARCGRRVDRQGAQCQGCIARGVPLGVWTVDCQRCGKSTPPFATEIRANEVAYELGFRVTDDGITLCPVCVAGRRSTG